MHPASVRFLHVGAQATDLMGDSALLMLVVGFAFVLFYSGAHAGRTAGPFGKAGVWSLAGAAMSTAAAAGFDRLPCVRPTLRADDG